ncbi:MAG: pilus assembly protein PilM [Planctomycetota bacterium]
MKNAGGFDIGTDTVKAVRLARAGGRIVVADLAVEAIRGLRSENDSLTDAAYDQIRSAARQAGLPSASVRALTPPRDTTIKHLSFPPVPPTRLNELIRFEVTENIADNQPISYAWELLSTDSHEQMAILLGVVPESSIHVLTQILRRAGVRPASFDAAILALANAYRYGHGFDRAKPARAVSTIDTKADTQLDIGLDETPPAPGSDGAPIIIDDIDEDTRTVALVDVGADHTLLVLMHKGEPIYARTMAGAGNLFTRTIAKTLGLPDEQAETFKRAEAEIVAPRASDSDDRPGRARPSGNKRMTAAEIRERLIAQRTGRDPVARPAPLNGRPSKPSPAPAAPDLPPSADDLSLDDSVGIDDSFIKTGDPAFDLDAPEIEKRKAKPVKPADIELDLDISYETQPAALPSPAVTPEPAPVDSTPSSNDVNDVTDIELETIESEPARLDETINETGNEPSGSEEDYSLASEPTQTAKQTAASKALFRDASGLGAAIENSVVFARQLMRSRSITLDAVLISGAGARLKGLSETLERRLRVPIEPLNPFRRLDTTALPASARALLETDKDRFALATGAALTELNEDAQQFSFTTAKQRARDFFFDHTLYSWYSALLFVVVVALMIYTPYRNEDAITRDRITVEQQEKRTSARQLDIDAARRDNDRLFEERKALEAREYSGDFLIRVLADLRHLCDENLFITEMSTSKPQFASSGGADLSDIGRSDIDPTRKLGLARAEKSISAMRETETLVERGKIYLRGIVRSTKDRGDAEARQAAFEESLRRLSPLDGTLTNPSGVFEMTTTIMMSSVEFAQRIRGQRYVMLEFVIECDVGGQFSPIVDERSRREDNR